MTLGTFSSSQQKELSSGRLMVLVRGTDQGAAETSQTWGWVTICAGVPGQLSGLSPLFSPSHHFPSSLPPTQEAAVYPSVGPSGELTWVPQGCRLLGCEGRLCPESTKHTHKQWERACLHPLTPAWAPKHLLTPAQFLSLSGPQLSSLFKEDLPAMIISDSRTF